MAAHQTLPDRGEDDWRALTREESALIDRLLAVSFPGRDELAAQARAASVRQIDLKGSLSFRTSGPRAEVLARVPVEGHYHEDATGPGAGYGPAVNLLLHVVDGRLHELEIYKDDGTTITVPPFNLPPDRMEIYWQ